MSVAERTEAVSQFTILLSPELKSALFRRARSEDRSAGSVARNALRAFLGEPPTGGRHTHP